MKQATAYSQGREQARCFFSGLTEHAPHNPSNENSRMGQTWESGWIDGMLETLPKVHPAQDDD